jgi:integrase
VSVRKRVWTTKDGDRHEAWILDYYDRAGDRHTETFGRRRDAEARSAAVHVSIRAGTHTAAAKSITVAEAAADWITKIELDQRERTTIRQYRQHIDLHIVPRIGREKISGLTAPRITAFRDELLTHLSRPLARKVLTSLKSILSNAQKAGTVAQNVALAISVGPDKRGKGKLKIGVDIPTVEEIKRILAATIGRARPIIITATFTGIRGSELRGLRWADVDLKRGELHVHQRADRYNSIGAPKSEAGERAVPIGPLVVNTLREWKLACPPSRLGLVFPTSRGNIIRHENIIRQIWIPAQIAAGVTVPSKTGAAAKYSGLHALRHFYASWCINRKADGGLELPAKMVQERLGHAGIQILLDTYGHLFPRGDDGAELAAAERLFLT